MSNSRARFPGTPGVPWGPREIAEWRARQVVHRAYADIQSRVAALNGAFAMTRYGGLDDPHTDYSLWGLASLDWDLSLPIALITGGVHGYETSGVLGALRFCEEAARDYVGRINLLVAPCISPWGYETINRWNPQAIDPNRSFREPSASPESAALMAWIAPWREHILLHVDLHETTDTDESEFRPALAARDGKTHEPCEIPDGFYLVDDSEAPQPDFQRAVIEAVAKVTHIAEADARGELIGSPMVAPGVIRYELRQWGLCAGVTAARYKTTTEVYPDSARTTPDECIRAQVTAVRAALDYVLS